MNSKQALVDALLNDRSHHIEFNGYLANHNKHVVIALSGLGASQERIKSYYDNYVVTTPYGFGLEAPKVSPHVITQDNWESYLGKRTSYSSYCQFFDQQEKELGMEQLLGRYVPTLLPGWVGALTHGTIHLGWALHAGHRWMTIEGLAYMAFSYVSCHPERPGRSADESVSSSLLRIATALEEGELERWLEVVLAKNDGLHPELVASGLQFEIANVLTEGHPLIHATPAWMDDLDIPSIWAQLHEAVTLLYMAEPGDFLVLHLITSLHAMEQIAGRLPADRQRYAISCFWIGMLGILFSLGEFPSRATLETLNSRYEDAVDPEGTSTFGPSWEEIIARVLPEEEEHNSKLVYVEQLSWKRFGYRSIYRVAAAHFTTTPELPLRPRIWRKARRSSLAR